MQPDTERLLRSHLRLKLFPARAMTAFVLAVVCSAVGLGLLEIAITFSRTGHFFGTR